MRTLYGLSQSPWTEKARWALDHHAIAYRYHEHVPVLGEVLLRIKARNRPSGTKPSVPLLVDGDEVLCSSFAIARHAEVVGRGAPLFPNGAEHAVAHWSDVSDRIIGAGRAKVLVGLRENREARREALPPFVPGPLRAVLGPIAMTAAMFLGSKYDVPPDPDAVAERDLRPALVEIEKALAAGPYLLGSTFSFADVAIAASLQALSPRKESKLGPATRAIWSNESLARDFEDLLAWRDTVYAKHRPGG
jgi:glutathione S-transferase